MLQTNNAQTGSLVEGGGQCDCACATATFSRILPSRMLSTEQYKASPSSTALSLNKDYWVVYGPYLHPNLAILNQAAFSFKHHFDKPHSLNSISPVEPEMGIGENLQSVFEQMVSLGLLVPDGYSLPILSESFVTLAAWLHLTTACNLACDYCYLPKSPTDMSLDTGRAVIDAVFRSALAHNRCNVKLKYAGGEPFLLFPRIVELHKYAQKLARRSGLELDGIILSNGTLLTSEMVETMQALNLRLMISLDGLDEFHDCQRHFADGQGSFDLVARSIDLALSHGLVPEISVTISGRNAAGLPELMSWILDRDLPFSLNFYRENDLSAPRADLQLEEDRIIEGMLAAYKVIEDNLPHRSLLAALIDRANLATPHLRTCAVGQNYLVFDTQGRVAKCQMDMGTTITDCNDPDPLSTVRASSDGIRNLKVGEKDECKECKWRYWCAGGCPLMAYRETGRYETKSPNCEIYKALFPAVIRMEGLRLLKYADELDEIVVYQPEISQVDIASE